MKRTYAEGVPIATERCPCLLCEGVGLGVVVHCRLWVAFNPRTILVDGGSTLILWVAFNPLEYCGWRLTLKVDLGWRLTLSTALRHI